MHTPDSSCLPTPAAGSPEPTAFERFIATLTPRELKAWYPGLSHKPRPPQRPEPSGPSPTKLLGLPPYCTNPEAARDYLERLRWPDEITCPHCGTAGRSARLWPREESRRPARPGVWKCCGCRRQFTVTVGTAFQQSHVPLHLWLRAIRLAYYEDSIKAADLARRLGVNAKTAKMMIMRLLKAITILGNAHSHPVVIARGRRRRRRRRPSPELSVTSFEGTVRACLPAPTLTKSSPASTEPGGRQ